MFFERLLLYTKNDILNLSARGNHRISEKVPKERQVFYMSRAKNKIGFGLFTIGLVLILAFLLGSTAAGSKQNGPEWEQYLAAKEQQLAGQMREYLGAAGYSNSGVNITHVTDEQGNREYTVRIHHQDFDVLEDGYKQKLMQELAGVFATHPDFAGFSHQVSLF